MRNFLAVILAIIAGVTASVGLVAWQLNSVIHEPEPVQDILGSGEAAEEFKASVPDALGSMAADSTGVGLIDDAVGEAVSAAAGEITAHEGFDQAWSESLELTRTGWVEDVASLRDRMEAGEPIADNATDAQLQLQLDPVAQVSVSMLEDAIRDATADVPGASENSVSLNTDPDLTVNTSVPPVTMMTAEQVVLAEELITLWPILLVIAGIVFLMALLVASSGSRWISWLVTGLVIAVVGVFSKFGFSVMQNSILEDDGDAAYISLLRPFLRAVQDWADPQILILIAIGVGIALLGILGGFISSNQRSRRQLR